MRVLTRAGVCIASAALAIACGQGSASSGFGERSDGAKASASESNDKSAPTAAAREADAPRWREVVLPAGTTLPVALDASVGSDTSRVEDRVTAHLTKPVVEGITALDEGSSVHGVVTGAERAGKVSGTSRLALRFDSLTPAQTDERYEIETSTVARGGPTEKKKDALKIAAPAAGGAIVGGIVGGKKGAVIGGAAGGGADTAVVMSQQGRPARPRRGPYAAPHGAGHDQGQNLAASTLAQGTLDVPG
jgi:hypothetical protein